MHVFYAARSDVPLCELCDTLAPALGLPSFVFLEHEGGWEFAASHPPGPLNRKAWKAAEALLRSLDLTATVDGAASENPELRVSILRARGKKLLGKLVVPREFEANYQVVLTTASDPRGPQDAVEQLLGTPLVRHASIDRTTTVPSEVDYAARYVTLERFAAGRLRIEPDLDRWGVDFVSDAAVADPGAEWYVEGTRIGIQSMAQRVTHLGRPVGMLRVTLLDVEVNEINSSGRSFRRMGERALQAVLASHGVLL